MKKNLVDHYLQYGLFTNPGLYEAYLQSLPDDISELGYLIRSNFIHRTTLDSGNVGSNVDMKYGDMTKVPWYRQAEDDNLPTVAAMLAELFRRDPKGLVLGKDVEKKLVLTCRYIAILMASVLKAKGIPTRVRVGFADYFEYTEVAWDHWVNQYWSVDENRWITIDVDGSLHITGFDLYDIPIGKIYWSADVWLAVRSGKKEGTYFHNAGGYRGLLVIGWQLFYDFHCLMNNEMIYNHSPKMVSSRYLFKKNTEKELKEIDDLARLMQDPDENFDKLLEIWNTKKEFRLLKGGLL